jgi:hypothetical protein
MNERILLIKSTPTKIQNFGDGFSKIHEFKRNLKLIVL